MMWGVAAIGFFSGIISGMGIGGGTILILSLLASSHFPNRVFRSWTLYS